MAELLQSILIILALLGAVRADDAVRNANNQQLDDLWAAAAAATPSAGVTITYTGSVVKATTAEEPPALTTGPAIAAAPPFIIPGRPGGFLPPWLRGIGAGRITSLPAGWGTGILTAGAVCGPYTLPINLPFSPPCPYSRTAAVSPTATVAPQPPPPISTTIRPTGHESGPPASVVKPLPPSSRSTVVVTATVTLKPDQPYTPGSVAATTLVTVRRQ
ncbi:hypothetical protein SCUCBS95973_006449 [Sporothrix curviconia]|uniref:Uncharacterized protein n=1 Tax=Sporothrix curviconia TaxID=1260050 RepID=A0ABP0C684_9PEZI